jgi:hypothetical protein
MFNEAQPSTVHFCLSEIVFGYYYFAILQQFDNEVHSNLIYI